MIKEKVAGYRVSYAQNREDIVLAAFFEDAETGFYVDVGANDPEIDSVTKYFYERGWSGINIEPQTGHYEHLRSVRKRDINLNMGVGAKKGKLTLRQYKGDGLSTLSSDIKDEYKTNPDDNTRIYADSVVNIVTLASIFSEHKVTAIQFMKVDVEGFEYEVLTSNDWSKYRPEVICIEANHIIKDWHSLLNSNGYELAFFDGLNEYFTDNKKPEIKQRFSYVKSVLLGKPYAPRALAQVIYEQNKLITKLANGNESNRQSIVRLEEELSSSGARVLYLQNELDEVSSLKAHIKKFTRKKLHSIDSMIEVRLQPRAAFQPVVPSSSKNLLSAAKDADARNLVAYNQTFLENRQVRLYRKTKHLIKRAIRGKKTGL